MSRELLRSLKAAAGAPGPNLSLAVGSPSEAWLRPVATRKSWLSAADIAKLTEWRNRFVKSFLTEFVATDQQTARWLADTVGPDDTRILFMVDGLDGATFAYMGVAFIDWAESSGEADAIVRGGTARPGLMTIALRTLLSWARGQLGLHTIKVRVRSDNSALDFYRKFGFQEVKRVALEKREQPDKIIWVESPSLPAAEPSSVHMVWRTD